ncbi:serine/threonine protein kinase [Fusarium austroafricanum]|uniref:Autophagy-related protein 1 n=1 Tax=Fusarium austroafricanum TaxID=2364996 RepID=A0A8H4NPU6_9HYPO|nr:serine/threonine protein kinase [Fusarium austroafricanum]
MDGDEPTQADPPLEATQNVLDPRRVGKQNSGFSDEDISDILCVLYPHSDSARIELERLVSENSPHIIGRDEADGVEPDYALEDQPGRFLANPAGSGSHAIILRLSSQLKNPGAGFVFGRNPMRCDVVFVNDPLKRVSNIHFRIYVNEYGTVMIEDQSTNGTIVDDHLLTSHPQAKGRSDPPISRWVLSSGSIIKIYLHKEARDLTFRVRIPRRDNEYDQAYTDKVDDFFTRHGLKRQNETITPGPGGHVDLFKLPPHAQFKREETDEITQRNPRTSTKRREPTAREWTGSGKYNRTGSIGKGAFAVVHRVTSKYDGLPYAAKEIEKRRFIKNGVLDQKVENEMKIMQRVQHPHIVRYMEHFEWDDRLLIIIMEFVPGGDLGKLISDQKALREDVVRTMSGQLLSALGYLHANNITHRDVKPDNILINSLNPIDLKLTDFGLSKMVDSEQTFLRTFCGTLLYCAPEVYTEYAEYDDNGVRSRGKKMRRIPGQRYNHAVDIWSLGGVLFYALTAAPPYPVKSGISYSELLHKIMTTRLNIAPLQRNDVSEQAIDFLCRMLERRPENRATVTELEGHPWFTGTVSVINASQSFDEISDDDMFDNFSQLQPRHYEEDRVSDSMGEESEKDNTTGPLEANQPRLFGEVGVSAIGSSGVIPEDYLNLSNSNPSAGETEILNQDEDEAYESEDATPRNNRRSYRQTTVSMAQKQSEDQLQSLVEDVASQSLGGNEPSVQNLGASRFPLQSAEFNTSKRKPPSYNTSDEYDNTPQGKPTMKRLKSEGNIEDLANDVIEEYKLLVQVPTAEKQLPGRQIDQPYNKTCFWEQDKATWHFNYPEMTHFQHKAFERGAAARDEKFMPGKTPLWDLAMKYFPPVSKAGTHISETRRSSRTPQDTAADEPFEFPPTAAPPDNSQIPDTLPPHTQIIVPVQEDEPNKRAIGVLESHPDSCVSGISIHITDALVSFGRGPANTEVFQDVYENRVPKYAFKLLLWKDDGTFDPSKDPKKVLPPWHRDAGDPNEYGFYISTKASVGISINGYQLASSDAKNHSGPSHHWARIWNGDTLMIWGDRKGIQTKLTFQCFWGASSQARGENKGLQLAPPPLAQKLDTACQRTEKRIKEISEKTKRTDAVNAELRDRAENIERERERSRAFEVKRREAMAYLDPKQTPLLSRMASASPASAPGSSYYLEPQMFRMSPDTNKLSIQ